MHVCRCGHAGCMGIFDNVKKTMHGFNGWFLPGAIIVQLKHCRVGETVRVMSDASELFQLQSSRQIDDPEVFTVS